MLLWTCSSTVTSEIYHKRLIKISTTPIFGNQYNCTQINVLKIIRILGFIFLIFFNYDLFLLRCDWYCVELSHRNYSSKTELQVYCNRTSLDSVYTKPAWKRNASRNCRHLMIGSFITYRIFVASLSKKFSNSSWIL